MAHITSPNSLKVPLLQALGSLVQNTTGMPVRSAEVVTRALDTIGITDPDDRAKAIRNANWLSSHVLRPEGLIGEDDKRGFWSLTPVGVALLNPSATVAQTSPVVPVSENPLEDIFADFTDLLVAPPPEPPPVPKVVESAWGSDPAGVCLYPVIPADTYSKDAYIKSIAIGRTLCFGGYEAAAPQCNGCPISGSCLSHQILRLSQIAGGLKKRDAEAKARDYRIANTASTVTSPVRATIKDEDLDDILNELDKGTVPVQTSSTAASTAPLDPNRGSKMTAQVESKCYMCRGTISKGNTVFHVPNHGLRHETCT